MAKNDNPFFNKDAESKGDARARAYKSGARIARERMRREDPEAAEALERAAGSDVVVVRGHYDHVELVLDALDIPYTAVEPERLTALRLRPEQLLVINCPGNVGPRAIPLIRRFVELGGSLFTTDWALKNVLEPAFPGVLAYNERPTADDVVRIEIAEHDNPFLTGVMDEGDEPLWWLEGSSYPIRVLDPERVRVLLRSRELEEKYGEAPVALTFGWEEGEVFHMISHYYLQRTELRTERHKSAAAAYSYAKGVEADAAMMADMADLSYGEVESAATSSRMLANWLAETGRRKEQKRGRRPRPENSDTAGDDGRGRTKADKTGGDGPKRGQKTQDNGES